MKAYGSEQNCWEVFRGHSNGTFDATSGGRDYGDSVLKLDGSSLAVRDYFTPFDQADILASDSDVGSSGPTLLPDQPGPHRHLLLQPTKHSMLYVIDRDQMGKFHTDSDAIPQRISYVRRGLRRNGLLVQPRLFRRQQRRPPRLLPCSGATHTALFVGQQVRDGCHSIHLSQRQQRRRRVGHLHQVWNGADDKPAVLYAYDAIKLGPPLYTSEQNAARDRAGMAVRFVIPVVISGRVYFGTRSQVEVYGLLK